MLVVMLDLESFGCGSWIFWIWILDLCVIYEGGLRLRSKS